MRTDLFAFWYSGKVSQWLVLLAYLLSAFLFLAFIYPNGRIFPFADEWWVYPRFVTAEFPTDLSWYFAEHNDHRIPIQKLLQIAFLFVARFDFRCLLLLNFILASLAVFFLVLAARCARGRLRTGDAIIVLVLMNLGSNVFYWGFSLTFLLSIFCVAAFLYATCLLERDGKAWQAVAAFSSLFCLSWTGLNGVILSTVITLFVMPFVVVRVLRGPDKPILEVVAAALLLLVNAGLWAGWHPSGASMGALRIKDFWLYLSGLLRSSTVIFGISDPLGWKLGLIALLCAAAAFVLLAGMIRSVRGSDRFDRIDLAFLAILAASVAVVLAISIGRSSHIPWWPGLVLHYGYLTVLLPVVSWFALSRRTGEAATAILSIVLIAFFGASFLVNAQWRLGVAERFAAENRRVAVDIAGGEDPDAVIGRDMKSLSPVDDPANRNVIRESIIILRQSGVYGDGKR